jgi:hypothetical protein
VSKYPNTGKEHFGEKRLGVFETLEVRKGGGLNPWFSVRVTWKILQVFLNSRKGDFMPEA